MNRSQKHKLGKLIFTAILMAIGLLIFKYLLMQIFGKEILFDASQHIVIVSFILYFVYCFIEENEKWLGIFWLFSFMVLTIISIQRIFVKAHNNVGLLLGLLISAIAIIIPRWSELKGKIKF